jgi:hypothetical protein
MENTKKQTNIPRVGDPVYVTPPKATWILAVDGLQMQYCEERSGTIESETK